MGIRDRRLSERLQLDPELTLAKAIQTVRQNDIVKCHGPAGVPRLATRCLCVLNTWLVVCLVPCAPMSIVCPLPSCYLIIVSVAPAVSPSLPSFVSLYSLLVSAVLC